MILAIFVKNQYGKVLAMQLRLNFYVVTSVKMIILKKEEQEIH